MVSYLAAALISLLATSVSASTFNAVFEIPTGRPVHPALVVQLSPEEKCQLGSYIIEHDFYPKDADELECLPIERILKKLPSLTTDQVESDLKVESSSVKSLFFYSQEGVAGHIAFHKDGKACSNLGTPDKVIVVEADKESECQDWDAEWKFFTVYFVPTAATRSAGPE